MKVGDLVRISVESIMSGKSQDTVEGCGIVVGKRYGNQGSYIMQVLWNDGVIEEAHENDLFVLREAIEDEIEELAMSFAD